MFEGIYNSENSPILKLGSDWKDIITNPSTVDLYFHASYIVINYIQRVTKIADKCNELIINMFITFVLINFFNIQLSIIIYLDL